MFVEPTALILGAGASFSYGYPLGSGLTRQILSPMRSKNFRDTANGKVEDALHQRYDTELSFLSKEGIAFEDWRAFVNAFHRSSYPTIDQFIGARENFAQIGKLLIAHAVMVAEANWVADERIFDDVSDKEEVWKSADFWYKEVLNHLVHPREIAEEERKQGKQYRQPLAIVTFNYDLSLQNAIYEHARHAFGLEPDQARKYMDSIDIIPVYGSVGKLNWIDPQGRIYGEGPPTPARIIEAAKSIKTISEPITNNNFESASRLVESSRFKFILGFGFHHENCVRLGLQLLGDVDDYVYKTSKACASSCGMTLADRNSIKRKLNVTFDQPESFTTLTSYLRNCESYRIVTDIKRNPPPAPQIFI